MSVVDLLIPSSPGRNLWVKSRLSSLRPHEVRHRMISVYLSHIVGSESSKSEQLRKILQHAVACFGACRSSLGYPRLVRLSAPSLNTRSSISQPRIVEIRDPPCSGAVQRWHTHCQTTPPSHASREHKSSSPSRNPERETGHYNWSTNRPTLVCGILAWPTAAQFTLSPKPVEICTLYFEVHVPCTARAVPCCACGVSSYASHPLSNHA